MNPQESSPESPIPTAAPRAWQTLVFGVAGLGLLTWIIGRHGGVEVLGRVAERLQDRWPWLLVPYAAQGFFTFLAIRCALPDRGRRVPVPVLAAIEQSANAFVAMVPMGYMTGDLFKVALLRPFYATERSVAAVTWVGLGTGLGHMLSAAGPLAAGVLGVLPWDKALLFASLGVLMTVPTVVILVLVQRRLVTAVATQLLRLPVAFLRNRAARILGWCAQLDAHLAEAHGVRRSDFRMVVVLRTANQLARMAEIWVAVTLLGYEHALLGALLYHAMSRAITVLLGIVPGRLGVMEWAAAALFPALGYPAHFGLEVALALRFTYVVNALWSGAVLAVAPAFILRKYGGPRNAEA